MGVRVACFIAFVLLHFAAGSESKKRVHELSAGSIFRSEEAELLLVNCRLELIHAREAVEYLELLVAERKSSGSNEISLKSRLSAKESIKKASSVLHPEVKQTLLDCLRKKNLMFLVSGEGSGSNNWYTKYLELFPRPDTHSPRRRKLLQSFVEAPAPSPAIASPIFSPAPSSDPAHSNSELLNSLHPSDLPLHTGSPPDLNNLSLQPTAGGHSSASPNSSSNVQSNKKNSSHKTVVVAVVVTAAVTLFIAALLFLCYHRVYGIGSGVGRNGSSKSFALGNSINKEKPGHQSFYNNSNHNKMSSSLDAIFCMESDVLNTSKVGTPLGTVVTSAEESAQVPLSPLKSPSGRLATAGLSPLKPPPVRVNPSASLPPCKGAPSPPPPPPVPPPSLEPSSGIPRPPPPGPPPPIRVFGALSVIKTGPRQPPPPPVLPPSLKPSSGIPRPPPPPGPPLPPPIPSGIKTGPCRPPPPPVPPPLLKPSSGISRPPPGPPPPPPIPTGIKTGPRPPPPPSSGLPLPRPPAIGLKPPQPSPLGPKHPSASAEGHEADAPKAKLKPFFWDKVIANPNHSMVWHQIKSGSFHFNEEMIETLFGYAPAEQNKNEPKKSSSQDPSTQCIQIIDQKKSQNLSILLKALNYTAEEVCDALQKGNKLPSELLQTLLKMAPTTEEELKLRLYGGELSRLGPADRFLKVLVDIPYAFKRLESLLFMCTLQEEASIIKESFMTLEAACTELRKSRLFLKLLEAVLKTGNRMNAGTFRGGAQAFKLDTLSKLSDVKGTDGKTTLLHFVVQEIIRSEGVRAARAAKERQSMSRITSDALLEDSSHDLEEHYQNLGLQAVSGLGGELENVRKAAVLDADSVMATVAKLGHALRKSWDFLNSDMKNIDDANGFHQALKSFVQNAEVDIVWLLEEEKRIMALVKSASDYFHGNTGKDEGLRLFVVVRDFLIILDKACKEVKDARSKPNRTPRKEDSMVTSSSEPHQSPPLDLRQRLFPAIRDRRMYSSSSDDDSP